MEDKALERPLEADSLLLSRTRTTAWKGWLDRDHSCRRLIRAIFHGKLSTDQRRKMKKVFFLTAPTCANIPPIPTAIPKVLRRVVALSKSFSKRKHVSILENSIRKRDHCKENCKVARYFRFYFKIRRLVNIGRHSSSLSLHDSRLLGNSINQAAISRDNN